MLEKEKIKCFIYREDVENGSQIFTKENSALLKIDPDFKDFDFNSKFSKIGYHTRAHLENFQKNIIGGVREKAGKDLKPPTDRDIKAFRKIKKIKIIKSQDFLNRQNTLKEANKFKKTKEYKNNGFSYL